MENMKTVTSVSGGQSSAYIAANYPSDFLIFALVCIEDPACTPKDKKLVQEVSDRIGREFIATAEDDTILHTMLDLEQYVGQRIDWVAGATFDDVAKNRGGWLPNKLHRYCTVEMKIKPMFDWWRNNCLLQENEPVKMQIGFRSGEQRRAKKMLERLNSDGLLEEKAIVGQHSNGNNKWAHIPWQRPSFPMIDHGVRRDDVVEFWRDKPVRFAERNNCVGCFHRNAMLLRLMAEKHPEKFAWFERIEQEKLEVIRSKRKEKGIAEDKHGRVNGRYQGTWKDETTYQKIREHKMQSALNFEDFTECDSGHCGL
jgi:hypothetical protein